MIDSLIRNASTSTYWLAWASIAVTVTILAFFVGLSFLGPVNDAVSVAQFLLMIPAALVLQRMFSGSPAIGLVTAVGVAAMFAVALMQAALVLGFVKFEETMQYVLYGTAVIGLWLIAVGILAWGGDRIPSRLAWLSVAAGAGYALGAIGWTLGGQEHPLAAIGFLSSAVALPWWAFWLSKVLAARS